MASSEKSDEALVQDSSINDDELVAESLLSWAKDIRYIGHCSRLVQQTMESIAPPNTDRSKSNVERNSWFLSSLLYIFFIIAPTGRTLGMNVCGLKFNTAQQQVVRSLLATTFGWYAVDYLMNRKIPTDPTQSREDLHGNDRLNMHRRLRDQMLLRGRSEPLASIESEEPTRRTNPTFTNNEGSRSIQIRIASVLRLFLKSASEALNSSDGPHSLEGRQESQQSRVSVFTWILRLHLAHFCVTGKYPSILHRLLRLDHGRAQDGSSPIDLKPQASRVVALDEKYTLGHSV
eukprot:scaffold22592_cov129-Cylindrotheca_fusiformis.AAC.36